MGVEGLALAHGDTMNARTFGNTFSSRPNGGGSREVALANWRRIAAHHEAAGNRFALAEALAAIAKLEAGAK